MNAPPLLGVDRATVARGTRLLLDGVSLAVGDGERVGIVGRNGSGKSTLLSVLAGSLTLDEGRRTVTGSTTVGMLPQDVVVDPGSIGTAIVGDRDEHAWAGDARIRRILAALLPGVDLAADTATLSGGMARRVALARLLVDAPDVVLLDEPTNHMDIESITALAALLGPDGEARVRSLVVVTHDRWFLDAVATTTWEVGSGQVRSFDGGYAAYVLARAERERLADVTGARRANLLRKELAWLRRGAPARTSKPKFRLDAAAALIADVPPPRDSLALIRAATARLGRQVIDIESVDVGYDQLVVADVTWHLGPGDRVGILGPNGAGKSTILALVAGQLAPLRGTIRTGQTVKLAQLTQLPRPVDGDLRLLRAVEDIGDVTADGQSVDAAQLLERLGFDRSRQATRVADLSGGERRRLDLALALGGGANVLLLDEPTNDLDTDTLAAVEDVLDDFPGTLLVVSHDRYFLERVTDDVFAVVDGRLRHLPGGVDEYLSRRPSGERTPSVAASGDAGRPAAASTVNSPARTAGQERERRKELARIERRLAAIDRAERAAHERITADPTNAQVVVGADRELSSLAAERGELEEQWLALATDDS